MQSFAFERATQINKKVSCRKRIACLSNSRKLYSKNEMPILSDCPCSHYINKSFSVQRRKMW